MITVGIDPGAKGGIVALHNGNVLDKYVMPVNPDGTINNKMLASYIVSFTSHCDDVRFGLESVHSLFGMSAKSNFSFGMNFQACISALDIVGASWEFIQPKVWQKEIFGDMDVVLNKKGKKDTKTMSIKRAQELYPDADLTPTERAKKPSDGICDALCIAEYLRRIK